jgi:hypothetical protein
MYDYGYYGANDTSNFKPIPVGSALTDVSDSIVDIVKDKNTFFVSKEEGIFTKKKGTLNTFEPSGIHFGFATLDLNSKNADRYIMSTFADIKEHAVFGYTDKEKEWE